VELDHLMRCVPHEAADQPTVIVDRLGARPIANAGGPHDRGVVAHVIDLAVVGPVNETVSRNDR
jgi:hypothetical protein